jgi:predicted RNase H-like HicB family nuclease
MRRLARNPTLLKIELEQEEDGRWIAEVSDLAEVLAYGQTCQEALDRIRPLALRVVADRLEHGEQVPLLDSLFAVGI